jgi:hypothetical protein
MPTAYDAFQVPRISKPGLAIASALGASGGISVRTAAKGDHWLYGRSDH